MWQFLIGAARSFAGSRAARAATRGTPSVAKKALKRGGGFANSGNVVHPGFRESFAQRALNSAWAIQGWNQILDSWFPSVKHSVTVTVNGGKVTPNTDVVHAALSIAFGSLAHRPGSIAKITIAVKNDPVNNSTTIVFLISSISALFVAEALVKLFRGIILQIIPAIGSENDDSAIGGVTRGIRSSMVPVSPSAPGVAKRDQAQPPPPGVVNPAGGGNELLEAIQAVNDELAKQFSGGAAFFMGREDILGGKPPLLCNVQNKGGPFDQMVYQKWLTRQSAPNPLPPASDGMDLRTLVAQVLHDPGVRPPQPATDKGPPVVENEVKGN